MDTGYNLIEFGSKLRAIRMRQHYTHQGVYNATGVHRDTMRKLENGLVVPKIDTLEILSGLFKTNLLLVFNQCRSIQYATDLYFKYEKDLLITKGQARYDLSKHIHDEVLKLDDDPIEAEQLFSMLDGLDSNELDLFHRMIEALKLRHKNISLENFHTYPLSRFEHRLMIHIASYFSRLNNYSMSNQLYYRLYHTLDKSSLAPIGERALLSKIYETIAHNHLQLIQDFKAYKTSDIGIKYSVNNGCIFFLSELLGIKAKAMDHLNLEDARDYKLQANLLERIIET